MEALMKSRQWLITIGLLVLVLAAVIGSILTRDLGPLAPTASGTSTQQTPLVDERPLQTARAMAKLASGADEHRFADQAAELADHEVDLAFHDALREAANHPAQPTPQNRELYEHASESEAQVKADQDLVDELKKKLAASGSHQERVQEQLDVAQAQLELDQDESSDAKEDLIRSGADPGSLIQRQFDQHQAAEHAADEKPAAAANNVEVNYQAGSLYAQFAAWRALRSRAIPLQQAQSEARQAAAALVEKHAALDRQVSAGKAKQRETPAATGQPSSQSNSAQSKPSSSGQSGDQQSATPPTDHTAVKALHRLSNDQKNLADLDKRIQDQQDLAHSYAGWIAVIHSHQRTALHGMIQSALWIILIVLMVYLADRSVDRRLAEMGPGTRLHTLRAVIRFAVQAVGVLLILFVIVGAPQQTTTFLGLATAGVTVAMKDFIVAFFGWFVLMGKNGLRVGDWVEINGVAGEVVEINLLRTVLLETGNWTDTGHPTGRKVAFVNSYAIEGHFFNFTTSGQWMWDELQITVPPNQDPYPLLDAIQKTVTKETETNAEAAEKEWQNAASNYKVRSVSAAPTVNLRPTSAGVDIHVRYIARAQERSAIRARLNQALVELLHHRVADEKESMSAGK
jgi:small-conductance mechanosensitive channel